jgi:hypothetical protein
VRRNKAMLDEVERKEQARIAQLEGALVGSPDGLTGSKRAGALEAALLEKNRGSRLVDDPITGKPSRTYYERNGQFLKSDAAGRLNPEELARELTSTTNKALALAQVGLLTGDQANAVLSNDNPGTRDVILEAILEAAKRKPEDLTFLTEDSVTGKQDTLKVPASQYERGEGNKPVLKGQGEKDAPKESAAGTASAGSKWKSFKKAE